MKDCRRSTKSLPGPVRTWNVHVKDRRRERATSWTERIPERVTCRQVARHHHRRGSHDSFVKTEQCNVNTAKNEKTTSSSPLYRNGGLFKQNALVPPRPPSRKNKSKTERKLEIETTILRVKRVLPANPTPGEEYIHLDQARPHVLSRKSCITTRLKSTTGRKKTSGGGRRQDFSTASVV